MTNCQVLELDLSAVQFEDLSDEMASTIQGGIRGETENIPVEGFASVSQSTAEGLRLVADFFDGLADANSVEDVAVLEEVLRDSILAEAEVVSSP